MRKSAQSVVNRPAPPPRPALARPRVHADMVGQLARRILSGALPPGAALPSTAALSAELGVSRTALREAIRTLSAKGLVQMRPRTGTRVCAREEWHLLDPQVLGWAGASLEPDFVRSLLECRQLIEPAAAAMAARRATAAQLAEAESAYLRMAAALPHDVAACCEADLEFHLAVLRASGNPVLAQLAGTISAALLAIFQLSRRLADSHREALSAHRDVVEAIRMRDAATAEATMRRLLGVAARDLGLAPDAEGAGGLVAAEQH